MEIKILNIKGELFGVQKTDFGEFHDNFERYPYLGNALENEIIDAQLIFEAKYPTNQWVRIPEELAATSDRQTRKVYIDTNY